MSSSTEQNFTKSLIKLVVVVDEDEVFVTALDEAGLGEAEREDLGGISDYKSLGEGRNVGMLDTKVNIGVEVETYN